MKSRWRFELALNPSAKEPLFLQIARSVVDDVRRGRLRPGDELPGSRSLAVSAGTHRNTVLAAYRELVAEGWLTVEPARGTFVSTELPEVSGRRFSATRRAMPARVGYDVGPLGPDLSPVTVGPHVLSLSGGIPDVRLIPTAPLARAFRRALRARSLLGYGDPRGPRVLRAALGKMLSATRGLTASEDTVFVTRGSQMALDLVARTLVAPGDVVAVEALGYRWAWEAFRAAGARLVPLPVDERGLRVDALEKLVKTERVRLVYVTPHHQYPTTVALSAGRRIELLTLAARERIAVLEDDYDHEFHYNGRPILPLASADHAGVVVYIGTLSKVLAPGLRIGYVVAPEALVERLARVRAHVDRQGDLPLDSAVGELLEDGDVQRHVRRVRRVYATRRDVLVEALGNAFGDRLSFEPPPGGTALWAKVDSSIDVDAWSERALTCGVSFQAARYFAFDGRSRNSVRFGFAQLDEKELQEAVRRLVAALRSGR